MLLRSYVCYHIVYVYTCYFQSLAIRWFLLHGQQLRGKRFSGSQCLHVGGHLVRSVRTNISIGVKNQKKTKKSLDERKSLAAK
jgi:hypothetical protein